MLFILTFSVQVDSTASETRPLMYIIVSIVAWLPVVADPIIYIMTHKKYRKAFKMLFTHAYNCIVNHDQAVSYVKSTKEQQKVQEYVYKIFKENTKKVRTRI